MRAVAAVDDSPSGLERVVLIFDDDEDAYVHVTSHSDALMRATLRGIGQAEIDFSQVPGCLEDVAQ